MVYVSACEDYSESFNFSEPYLPQTSARKGHQTSQKLGWLGWSSWWLSLQKSFSYLRTTSRSPPQITWSYYLPLESTFAVGLFIIMWVLGTSSLGKQPCYFERNFSNSEKVLKPDSCHGPVGGRCGIKEKQNHREWVEGWQKIINVA